MNMKMKNKRKQPAARSIASEKEEGKEKDGRKKKVAKRRKEKKECGLVIIVDGTGR